MCQHPVQDERCRAQLRTALQFSSIQPVLSGNLVFCAITDWYINWFMRDKVPNISGVDLYLRDIHMHRGADGKHYFSGNERAQMQEVLEFYRSSLDERAQMQEALEFYRSSLAQMQEALEFHHSEGTMTTSTTTKHPSTSDYTDHHQAKKGRFSQDPLDCEENTPDSTIRVSMDTPPGRGIDQHRASSHLPTNSRVDNHPGELLNAEIACAVLSNGKDGANEADLPESDIRGDVGQHGEGEPPGFLEDGRHLCPPLGIDERATFPCSCQQSTPKVFGPLSRLLCSRCSLSMMQ